MNIGVEEPPGVQNFSRWPGRMPPLMSSSWRSVMPSGASYWPGLATCPLSEYSVKPGDFSLPIDLNQSLPLLRIAGTDAMDSTLFTTVGQAYRPATAGKGGRSRGWPRRPSSESSSAVSSPQMYAPAPACTVSSRSSPEPRMLVPR